MKFYHTAVLSRIQFPCVRAKAYSLDFFEIVQTRRGRKAQHVQGFVRYTEQECWNTAENADMQPYDVK